MYFGYGNPPVVEGLSRALSSDVRCNAPRCLQTAPPLHSCTPRRSTSRPFMHTTDWKCPHSDCEPSGVSSNTDCFHGSTVADCISRTHYPHPLVSLVPHGCLVYQRVVSIDCVVCSRGSIIAHTQRTVTDPDELTGIGRRGYTGWSGISACQLPLVRYEIALCSNEGRLEPTPIIRCTVV